MAKVKSIKLNYFMNCVLTVSSMLFSLLSYPYVARILQPENMGKVTVANSMVAYFGIFAMLGIPTYGIRVCAKVRDDKERLSRAFWELLFLNLMTLSVVYLVFAFCLFLVPRMAGDKALFLVMGSSIFFQVIGVEWLFKALEEYSYITIRSLIFKFLGMILMFLLIRSQDDYVIYGGLLLLVGTGSGICNFFRINKYILPLGKCKIIYDIKKEAPVMLKHLKAAAVFVSMSMATTVYNNLDVVMLGFMSGDTEAGYYSAAVKVKGVLAGFVTALGAVLLPRMSYYVEQKRMKEFNSLAKRAIGFVCLISVPTCIIFMVGARICIVILSGAKFLPAVASMRIIMPTLILIGLSNLFGIQILIPLGKEKKVLFAEILGAITDLILNAILIPPLGAKGAAIGTLAAEAVVTVSMFISLYRIRRQNRKMKSEDKE